MIMTDHVPMYLVFSFSKNVLTMTALLIADAGEMKKNSNARHVAIEA